MVTALITGASSGLGAEYARQLARRGDDLVLVARDGDRLEAVAGRLMSAYGVRCEVLPADLADAEDTARVAARARDVDVLVAGAGFDFGSPLVGVDPARLDRALAVMVRSVAVLGGAASAGMMARSRSRDGSGAGKVSGSGAGTSTEKGSGTGSGGGGVPEQKGPGRILVVSSTATFAPLGGYSAIKTWALAYVRSLSVELAGTGVTATAVLPGLTRTEFHARAGLELPGVPGWLWLSARRVVTESLRDAERGRAVSIPSRRWRVIGRVAHLLPRPVLDAVTVHVLAGRQRPRQG